MFSKVTQRWRDGWAFYISNGISDEYLPLVDDCVEWIKGYGAAMADDGLKTYREHPSIMAALLYHVIDGDLLEACLLAAEIIPVSGEGCRWPSVPVRGL